MACSSVPIPPRPVSLAPLKAPELVRQPVQHELRLQNGLRVIHVPSSDEDIRIGLYLAGGSLDDPSDRAGMTAFLANVGLMSSPEQTIPFTQEALALGTNLVATSDNLLFGWHLRGSEESASKLLSLLSRLVQRRSFNDASMKRLVQRAADELAGVTDPGVRQALAVAVSSALGHSTPRGLYGNADRFRSLDTRQVKEHWGRRVSPERAVLVVHGRQKTKALIDLIRSHFSTWRTKPSVSRPLKTCWPDQPMTHLIVDPSSTSKRVYALVALRVPSLGEPGRKAIELALNTFNRTPGGRLAKVLGEAKARDISPHIVDLGWNSGEKGSILLMRLSGPSRETLRGLWDVIETLQNVGTRPPTLAEQQTALRYLRESHSLKVSSDFKDLKSKAISSLYGWEDFIASDFEAHVKAVFRRRNLSVIGVGPNPLGPVLSELGQLTIWDSGGLILEGLNRTGCP
jgi:hypothetical protein